MIQATDHLSVEWVPVSSLCATPQPCQLDQVAFYLRLMTEPSDNGQHVAPIVVDPVGFDSYRIRDGRHRWLAHVIAGRQYARCVVVRGAAV